eukprot:TRINITY_DN786_c0_g1_i3.p1 TRINITY_DN786_c0_g1~~TRINITY_DN786_c0_g1_i3.p1  ORF type:complete len:233 (+),score=58.91 TRINITY_DN786_c0_g1_i3:201-899(+)
MPLFGLIPKTRDLTVVEQRQRKKKNAKGSTRHTLKQSMRHTLGSGVSMREAVRLPNGENRNEWLAMNTIEMANNTQLVFGFISDFCNEKSCPAMTAGKIYTYKWQDPKKYPKPTMVSADKYIELLFEWVNVQLDDESIFPLDTNFGKNFLPAVKQIWKRLARVYFHIYHHHAEQIRALNAEAHVDTCFRHFYYFSREFDILKEGEDFAPVATIITTIRQAEEAKDDKGKEEV